MHHKGRVFTEADFYRVSIVHTEDLVVDINASGRINLSMTNHSGTDVSIKTRMAPSIYLAAAERPMAVGYIQINVQWTMSSASFRRSIAELEREGNEFITEMILRAIDTRFPNSRNNKKEFQASGYLSIDIKLSDIIDNGGNAYIQDLDLMICLDERAQAGVTHPCDRLLKVKKEMEAILPYIGTDTFVFGIKAVDNNKHRHYSDRFMLVGDTVQRIPIERHDYLPTGIHVLMRPPIGTMEKDTYINNVVPKMFTFEQADRLFGMADSIEKVLNGGDISTAYKNKIAERAHERALLEMERKEELAVMEAETNRLKARDAQQKLNDERSREDVKGFGDWVRAISGALTAVIALTGIFMKLKPA